ncbi:cell division protein FtsQ/DivIB [Sandaracinobacteroides hominis]|uniref:cell division protein FtsQ/DivIB n=1 Tax=Sandaracinobacteroides hominis TaxID=2780086 RepID=UPI0018F37846|nr:cell division protein FtsQ/DivIB [Sandaracinobacteroides hominis]
MSRKPQPRKRAAPQAAPVALPLAPRTVWKLIVGGFAIVGATGAAIWAIAAGVPRDVSMAAATASSQAGFVVRQVDIQGARNQPRLSIYREVLEGGSDSMLLADLPAVRARLKELPWVKDADVQRRWPDRLEVRVLERKPAALWQVHGRMRLIDDEGVVLPAGDLGQFSGLPLLVGAGAQHEAAMLLKLVATQPQLAGDIEAAQWIGGRRWDLRMKSGETIALPEGVAANAALMRFAEIHRETPLLGRGFVRFDLRLPDKMVVRVGGEPGQPVKPRTRPQPVQPQVQPTPEAVQPAPAPAAQQTARFNPESTEVVI